MKMKMILALAVIAVTAMSFKLIIDKTAATVQQVDGLEVFAYSRPVAKYDILGQVEVRGIVKNEKGPHMVELLVGYAKKDYPSGEAIIMSSAFYKAEVIRFKE